jgi:hypothetical protein
MAEKNAVVKAKDQEAFLAKVEKNEQVSSKEMAEILDSFEANDENEVTGEYMQMEPGSVVRAWFQEMTEMQKLNGKDGETVPAVRLLLADGTFGINANAVIVSTCQRFKKVTPIEITCTGKKRGPNGDYFTFKIIELTVKK